MNVYTTDKIRNVVVLGHGGCGKTSLVEAMAFLSGMINRMGKVQDGNTISDFDKEEIQRQFSVNTSLVPVEWDNVKINILDTPGYFDFIGEVEEAVSVADAAIIVVSGKSGVQVGTEKAWEICEKYKLPRMFFVTEMDIDEASFRQVVEDLTAKYGKKIAPFHLPIRESEKFVGYINVVSETGNRWNDKGEVYECEIPEYNQENLKLCKETLMEAVAETSEALLERYFNGEVFSDAEIRTALRKNIDECNIFPITMGSSILVQGIYTLMDDIVKYLPSPEKKKVTGVNVKNNEIFHADYDFSKEKTAFVFKTIVDPFIGKYSLIKVKSGVMKSDEILYNANKEIEEKVAKLYVLRGSKALEIEELHPGDIGAIAKLSDTETGDTLSTKSVPVKYASVDSSIPYTKMRFKAKNKGDEDKISNALHKLMLEDLTLKLENDVENHQALLVGIGDQQLDVVKDKLFNKYKVEIEFSKPKVSFKETVRKKADVESKYKKQSGGHGQYGHVKVVMEPSGNLEEPYEFVQSVVGGAVPKNYFPAVEKGIIESVKKGPLANYPVVGVKVTLYDGSYHSVDSSEQAFKMAAIQAFKKAFLETSPILLEPIAELKILIDESYTGEVMGDLNKKRGRVLGMNPQVDGKQEIVADIPMAELFGYSTDLRSLTGGSGVFSYTFSRYEQAPSDVQEREIASRKQEEEEV